MSFNLVDLVKDQLGGAVLGQVGNLMGDQSGLAESALGSAIPALLNGLGQRAQLPGGADSMFGAINEADDSMLDNLGSLLGGSDSSAMINAGSTLLGSLFGNSGLGSLAGVISAVSGLSKGNTGSLLGLLAPIVMGVVKRKLLGGGGMNASGMLDLFKSQQSNINAAMPAGLSDQLNASGFLSSISSTVGDAAGTVTDSLSDAAQSVGSAGADAAQGGSSLLKKLLPIVALVLIGWLGMKFFSGSGQDAIDDATNAASSAAGDAATAVKDAVGDLNIDDFSSDLSGMFDTAKSSLEGITDADSATAALPDLTAMGDKVAGLGGLLDKIPEGSRGAISGIITTGIETLTPIIEKLRALPGVGAIIDPVITPIMETLQGLAG